MFRVKLLFLAKSVSKFDTFTSGINFRLALNSITIGFMISSILLGEFFGTFLLILLGNGVVANVLLKDTKGEGGNWFVITTGWAFAVMMGVFVALAFGAPAHLNPAVSLGMAISSGDFTDLFPFVIAQLLGAMFGAAMVYLHHGPHWKRTKDQGAKLACFATAPAIRSSGWNIISEAIGTFVLVVGVAAIFAGDLADGLGPFLVGGLIWSIGLSLGGTTGYAINPARDLGPRIVHAILPIPDKGPSDFDYGWIPVVGPLIGGAVAGVFLLVFPVF